MASVSVEYSTHLSTQFIVSNLQEYANLYDKFVWHIFQPTGNGSETKEIITFTYDWNEELGDYYSFYFTFENPDWLGNNPLSPGCTYVLLLDCYWAGEKYTLPSVTFTTDSISAPSGSISPKFYPYVKDQGSVGNCVACSLSTAMEIFQYTNTGVEEHYSVSYLFGSDGRSVDDMYFDEGVDNGKYYGSPRWEMVATHYPDMLTKSNSVSAFNNADTYTTLNAANQKFSGYANVDFYDTSAVKSYISDYGYFMLNFRVPYNFYDVGSDGIVPQPDEYAYANHSVALIGLTTKNGKKHWIAQNSWGTSWGDNGRCYIPYDWGCNGTVAPTTGATNAVASWTCECYAVWNTRSLKTNSYVPTITDLTQTSNQKSINVSWDGSNTNDVYLIFARQYGDSNWYKKATVTETSTIIPVDIYGEYEVMIIGLLNSYRVCSAQSAIGSVTIKEQNPRPTDFSWTYAKNSGGDFNLTENEWISLCDSVIAFLNYTENLNTQIGSNDFGLSTSTTYYDMVVESKTSAVTGDDFTATAFNYVRYVIGSINGVGTGIGIKYRGDTIYASYLNTIVDKLNLI